MNKSNLDMQDDKIKDLLSGTKIKAGENLKFRIMHQIETEQALARKKVASARPAINNIMTIFGIMYALIVLVGLVAYFSGGKDTLESIKFFAPAILITSACGIFLGISTYDDQRRSKHKAR